MKARRKSPLNLTTTEPQHCSIGLRLKILARLPFFAGINEKALEIINSRFVEVGYQPGEWIYMASDPAERLFVVAEGKVKLLQHGANDRNILLDILTQGEFFGNLAALGVAAYLDSAQAQTPTCVLSIRSEAFRGILDEHAGLAIKTLQVMAERLNDANQRVLQLSSMPVDRRIAYTLLKLALKFGKTKENLLLVDVPLSREDIAGMTGATPETASRVMSQLQTTGIIISGRQWVGIQNLQALEDIIGEA